MKKIIVELLEQYEKDMDMPQFAIQYYTDEYIISKHYGFIKWLVDNDKIDDEENNRINRRKVCGEDKHGEFRICKLYINCAETEEDLDVELFDDYERLLMHLAIQDEPIEFLCSILK